MLAQRQLGAPDAIIDQHRDAAQSLSDIREAWPVRQTTYAARDARVIITQTRKVLRLFNDALNRLAAEGSIKADPDQFGLVVAASKQLQPFDAELAGHLNETTQGDVVTIRGLRTTAPAALERVLVLWRQLFPFYDVVPTWLDTNAGASLLAELRELEAFVSDLMVVNPRTPRRRLGLAILLGAGLLGLGGLTWYLIRRSRRGRLAGHLPSVSPGVTLLVAKTEEESDAASVPAQ